MQIQHLLYFGALYHLGLFIFHGFFWKIFRWQDQLVKLHPVNQAVMQLLNLCLMFIFIILGIISFFYAHDLVSTELGQVLLLLIAIFWSLRAIGQVVFFGLRNVVSIAFLNLFLLGAGIYFVAWFCVS